VKVGKRAKGGWDGELDIVAFHPSRQHFLHIECSFDAHTWEVRETKFGKKFAIGKQYARELFSGMSLPTSLDQVIVHGYASAPARHRALGGGRLITSEELVAEIMYPDKKRCTGLKHAAGRRSQAEIFCADGALQPIGTPAACTG
jgi:hypothetical protein